MAFNAALRGYIWDDAEDGRETLRLACVAVLSSWLPQSLRDLRPFWYEDLLPTYVRGKVKGKRGGLPVLMCHGTKDKFVPFKLGKRSYKRAEKIGFSVDFEKYKMGHGVCTQEMMDLWQFLSRKYLPDPVLRIEAVLGPALNTAGFYTKKALSRAGMDPELVNEAGWLKSRAGEGQADSSEEVSSRESSGSRHGGFIDWADAF